MSGRTQDNLFSLGNTIRELRENRGYSQEKLGEIIGLSRKAVGDLEREEATPKYETVEKLCEALNAEPNYFYPEKYRMESTDERMITLQTRLGALSEDERRQFYMMADGILDVIQKPGWNK